MAMAEKQMPGSGAMEGGGAYNKHAKVQAGGNAVALLHLAEATRKVELESGQEPIVIVDYGSSQGKNSLGPMRTAIETLRSRLGPDRSILVCHVDLPINDFNALFESLDGDPDRYTRDASNVYSCAIGRSFYQSVLPPNHVHIGWSAYAALWFSAVPQVPADHFWLSRMTGAARAAYERQGAQDWEAFLKLRARELRPGGRLVVVLPGANDDGLCGYESFADHAYAVLADMVDEGAISADERSRIVLACWPRPKRDLLAPFQHTGRFENLTVEICESIPLADPIYAQYQRDGNVDVFASKHASFFRATFVPSLVSAVRHAQDPEARRSFGDRLEHGLKQRLMRNPAPFNSLVDTIVLAKSTSVAV
jgi:hypothetical protein